MYSLGEEAGKGVSAGMICVEIRKLLDEMSMATEFGCLATKCGGTAAPYGCPACRRVFADTGRPVRGREDAGG